MVKPKNKSKAQPKASKSKKKTAAKPINDVAHESESAPSSSSRPIIVTNRPILKDPMISEELQPSSGTPIAVTVHTTVEPEPKTETDEAIHPDVPPAAAEPASQSEPSATPPVVKAPDASAEAKKEAEHNSEIQKLVDSKRYFLPINTIEKRRSKRFVAAGILLSLVLVVAWGDIALDAGLIQLPGIKPLTHFFST